MAAYYQQPRQRVPLPRESQLDESGGLGASSSLTPQEVQQLESYLIFPEPTSAAASNRHGTIPKPEPELEPSAVAQLSPTPSSVFSIQTSLLASVARRSTSRGDLALSQRSASREYEYTASASSPLSEWEELKGPLPPLPSNLSAPLSPRGRRGRTRSSPVRSLAGGGRGGEGDVSPRGAGIGWDWTLDREEMDMELDAVRGRPDDLLLGLRWTASRPSTGGEDTALLKAEMETWYEDAVSQWQPSHAEGFISGEEPTETTSLGDTNVNIVQHPAAEMLQFRATTLLHLSKRRSGRPVLRPSSPTRNRQRPSPCNRTEDANPPPQMPSIFSSSFRTFLEAFFAIDQSTFDLIDNYPTDDTPPQPTTIFGLPDDIVGEKEVEQPPPCESHIKFLNPPEDLGQSTDRMLRKGFSASQLVTHTNPFMLPFLLLEMGWEYGVKSFVTISTGRGVERNDT
ncbi:hypothetical protein FRB97_004189 [Tulasnella sp. 331]|nr:hypothetical protein FRB97_004189 [Tulasnella sp. 331]KAG8881809.1 hypothetical protein FRB98_004121 [Tulasnella sp. 332]